MKIQIRVSKDYISFSLFNKKITSVNLNNTNVINVENIVFEDKYINDNIELVSSFLTTIIIKNNINKIKINDQDLSYLVLDIIKNIKYINTLEFSEDKPIDYIIVNKIIENVNIEVVECLKMPKFIFELLNKNKIMVNIKDEVVYLNTFMDSNDLGTYSKIYYRRSIKIDYELNETDLQYMDLFLRTNAFLSFINLYSYSAKQVESLINLLEQNNRYNIMIRIYESDIEAKEIVTYIKKTKGEYLKKNKINILVMYKDKKKPNIYRRLNIKSVKLIFYIIIAIIAIYCIFIFSYKKEANKNIDFYNDLPTKFTSTKSELVYKDGYYERVNVDTVDYEKLFKELTLSNDQTVAWISINNTKINLPIPRASNNSFYKKHLFNRNRNKYGWMYMDYNNNTDKLDQNTIIYCNSSEVCKTLTNTVVSNWYIEEDNHKITFNMPNSNNTYYIFGIELTKELDLQTDYGNNFNKYISKIQSNSIYDFNEKVADNDSILTIVTNYKNKNLVISAVKKGS